MGVPGSLAAYPWQGGSGHSCSPPRIMTCHCFLLVSPCQGEPGRFGEPGDPGEDVSRRHMAGHRVDAEGSGCWWGWDLCPHHAPPSPCWWLGVFAGSQGVLRSQRGEGECPLVPGMWGASQPWGATLGGTVCPAPPCLPAGGHTVCSLPSCRDRRVSVCRDHQDRMGLRA